MAKKTEPIEIVEAVVEAKPEPKIEVKQVNLSVLTVNDHERRITELEAKIWELTCNAGTQTK